MFCLLILLIPTVIFIWALACTLFTRKPHKSSGKTKVFVISINDIPKLLSLNMVGLAYICNPDDYPSLTALGVPNLIRLVHVRTGEVVILVPQLERKTYGN